jgi:PAS domain S-box-containing protein
MLLQNPTEILLVLATVVQLWVIVVHWKIGKQTGWIRATMLYCIIYSTMVIPRLLSQFVLYGWLDWQWSLFIQAIILLMDSVGFVIAGTLFLQLLQRQMQYLEVAAEREVATEAAHDIIIHLDEHGTITFINDAVTRILGFRKAQLEGKSIQTIMPYRYREKHKKAFEKYKETGVRTLDWSSVKISALTTWGNGAELPMEISFAEFSFRGERRFVGVMRKINGE